MYNIRQKHKRQVLTFDMRSRAHYHAAHLLDSISFPLDLCDEQFFIAWDPARIEHDIIKNKEKNVLFKNRKRMFISIVAANEDIQSLLKLLPMVFSTEHLLKFKECPVFEGRSVSMEDVFLDQLS